MRKPDGDAEMERELLRRGVEVEHSSAGIFYALNDGEETAATLKATTRSAALREAWERFKDA